MNEELRNCQLPNLPEMSIGNVRFESQSFKDRLKRFLAKPWNYTVKPTLKKYVDPLLGENYASANDESIQAVVSMFSHTEPLAAGDWVRVRAKEEIASTLNRWNELRGCAFLDNMWKYCGTSQRILQPMDRFLDERDYKVKKCKGLVLLEGVLCFGTPVFGRCDRACHLFWRVEWLEKIEQPLE